MQLTLYIILALIIAILAVVFAIQNPGIIGVKFLAWDFQGSLALVLLVTFAGGFIASALVSLYALARRKLLGSNKKQDEEEI